MDPRKTHGAFSWMELHTDRIQPSQAFYEKVLGWDTIEMPMQDGSKYPAIGLGGQPLGGYSSKLGLSGVWLPYVTVDDVDARAGAVAGTRGELLAPPSDAPGVGRIAVIRDPAGGTLALIRYA